MRGQLEGERIFEITGGLIGLSINRLDNSKVIDLRLLLIIAVNLCPLPCHIKQVGKPSTIHFNNFRIILILHQTAEHTQ